MDKSEIIEILNEWNYWKRELPQTHVRTIYDSRISTLLNYNEKTKKRELRVFSKTIEDLQLKNIDLLVIHEDNTSDIIYDDLNIKTINVKEWLITSLGVCRIKVNQTNSYKVLKYMHETI
ncbi:MAG: hypothetical protein U9R50_12040 [Campylobacterota bacterium]|nr:hypothetical protein [Campylobacterota bacterium]